MVVQNTCSSSYHNKVFFQSVDSAAHHVVAHISSSLYCCPCATTNCIGRHNIRSYLNINMRVLTNLPWMVRNFRGRG